MNTREERARYVLKRLAELYPDPPIPLQHEDAFTLLVAVLLSAHNTDASVNKVTPALFALANTPQAMMQIPLEEVDRIVRPCGLASRKAPAIVNLSKMLVEEHGGQVPADLEALERLPGVGHKTASVVMSQAFGVPSFPVDVHIHRLAQRWGLTSGKSVKQTEADLRELFPRETWNKMHLRIIYYGRQYCTARGCHGYQCEICRTLFPERTEAILTRK